jgi:hypothetical protein
MLKSLKLVPPSMRVIARLLADSIDVTAVVRRLVHDIYNEAPTWGELSKAEYPHLRLADMHLGPGLAACMTQTKNGELLWLHEIRCHAYCGILGNECGAVGSCREWLQKIYEKHEIVFDNLPNV